MMKFTTAFVLAALPFLVSGQAFTVTADPNTDTTLDPAVLATGFFSDGLANATPGQVASQTSKNNFINFCKSHPDKPITNGLQVKTGSCNPAPMGIIAATTNMPSCKFQFPPNLDTSLKAFQPFDVKLKINHLQAGNFVNAQASYYAAPQIVNGQGDIVGHSHFVIEAIDSITTTTVSDPTRFAFFKGVDTPADADGILTVKVSAGLPDGFYKLTSINAAMNHQPVLVAVAQHGTTEDTVYFTVGKGGADVQGEDDGAKAAASSQAAAAGTTLVNNGANGGAVATAAAAAVTAPPAAAATPAAAANNGAAAGGAAAAGGFQLKNGQDAIANNKKFATIKAGDACTDTEPGCAGDQFAQCVGGKIVVQPCAGGTVCRSLPLVNKAGTSASCDTAADADARIAATGATARRRRAFSVQRRR
jgi:hypothetical protein